MSLLYPFPPRNDIPPPVPPKPKPKVLPQLNCDVPRGAFSDLMHGHKRSMPSLSKMTSLDSIKELRSMSPTKRRNHSNDHSSGALKPSPTKLAKATFLVGSDTKTSPTTSSPQSSPQSSSRLASAKQKAKDVWMSRRKNSKSEIEAAVNIPLPPHCMDSPTLPGIYWSRGGSSGGESVGGWRQGLFGEGMASSAHLPSPDERIPSPLDIAAELINPATSSTAGHSPPETPRPTCCNRSPPKPTALLNAPTFLEKPKATVERPERSDSLPEKLSFRERADSAPLVCQLETQYSEGETPRPGSADSAVPPLNIRQKKEEKPAKHRRKKSSISSAIPIGFPSSEAFNRIPRSDLSSLRQNAQQQAASFNILTVKDVDLLAREIQQLESRCQYLRNTRASLRQGRRTLHTRMIAYLRSARSGAFSQDSLLKQEEALSELDLAIEEWEAKLEKAEQRRAQLKQKLLEHVAASLSLLSLPSYPSKECVVNTPPATPERQRDQEKLRESITVYALLADVSQEIDRSISCLS